MSPFDLHVLSTPPAFILSQDQTLMLKYGLLYSPLRETSFLCKPKSFVWFLHQSNWLNPLHFSMHLLLGFVLWTILFLEFSGLHYCLFVKVLTFLIYFSITWLSKIPSGEDGIWTHAPLLTTYSLSRGAPSASLGTSPNGRNKNGEGGIRTHVPLRTNGFQDRLVMTTSIPLHILFCYRFNPQCKNHSIKSSLLCQLLF